MPDPAKQPSKGQQIGEGFKTLQKLVGDSKEKNKNPNNPVKTAPEPPPVDTGSFGGLLTSLKNRAKYAIYGPDEKK